MIRAWHFVGSKLRDGRPVPPDGQVLVHGGRVEPCVFALVYDAFEDWLP